MGSLVLDDLDRQLAHALQVDGRAPFSRIAEALGVSDRTLARRYHRLRSTGALRVRGLSDRRRLGQADWLLRARCAPTATTQITTALARRDDTSWVCVASGGTELTCIVRATDRDVPLIRTLAHTTGIADITAHRLLRQVAGQGGWPGRTSALSPDQVDHLRPAPPDQDPGPPVELGDADHRLLSILAEDGRTHYPRLAAAVGYSESTIRRRLIQLRHTDMLSFTVETDARLFGRTCEAVLWLSIAPTELTTVAEALAGHVEVAVATAITGPANLVAVVICHDADALYDYLTTRLGALHGVLSVEPMPITRYVKRAGPSQERS